MSPLPAGMPSMVASMAIRTILGNLGITDEDAVRIIDAFSSRGLVIGYLLTDEEDCQTYQCRSLHPSLPDECRLFVVRVKKGIPDA